MKLLYLILILIMLTALIATVLPRQLREVPLVILTGESNSGGYAPNADASAPELAARPELQILNVNTMLFESLDIGTNNNLDHAELNNTMHGIELELANSVANNELPVEVLYLVQTGQGSSNINDWNVGAPSGFWTKWLVRINATKLIFASRGWKPKPIIFYSHGLNDYIDNNMYGSAGTPDAAAWKTKALAHIAKMRGQLGPQTPVVMTKFKAMYATFNTVIDEIAAGDDFITVIQTSDTGVEWQPDTYHWTYAGYKQLAQLFIDEMDLLGPPF